MTDRIKLAEGRFWNYVDRDRRGRAAVLTKKRASAMQQRTVETRKKNGTYNVKWKRNR